MKYLAFDIEVCSWPEDEDTHWKEIAPLGISCISLFGTGWDEPNVYYAGMVNENPKPRAMDKSELCIFTDTLAYWVDAGYTVTGWNSMQFDLQCLFMETQDDYYKDIAYEHIDPMFYIFCSLGWPVSLNAVSRGLGLPGKMTDGVSGKDAPDMWMNGNDGARWKVLEYVGKDAIVTSDIIEVATRIGKLQWRSQKGKPFSLPFRKPKTVEECLNLPERDNSWMTKPLYRSDFVDWIEK